MDKDEAIRALNLMYERLNDIDGMNSWVKVRDLIASFINKPQHQWQPIETAPRDDSLSLYYTEGNNIVISSVKYFSLNAKRELTDYQIRTHGLGLPTHWMPLPDTPKEK